MRSLAREPAYERANTCDCRTRQAGYARAVRLGGFTLIELLVVLTVIGLLIAMLLPAVQSSRESARRVHCANQLKQVALASHSFHGVHKRFPPGWTGRKILADIPPYDGQFVGSLAFLLPHLEQAPLAEDIDSDKDLYGDVSLFEVDRAGIPYWSRYKAWELAQTRVPTFLCPSDHAEMCEDTYAVVNLFYDEPQGLMCCSTRRFYAGAGSNLGRTNYLGVAGYTGTNGGKYAGVYTNRSKHGFQDITDGSSNTMLFGEVLGARTTRGDSPEVAFGWMGSGAMSSFRGVCLPCGSVCRFDSFHPAVVQFAFADGSVHGIARTIDYRTYIWLSSMNDGEVIPQFN